ncbi:MAG: translation initiation factor [Nanoarchaeota archaeon]|nr:translation initiation factor [Nanoarchaeota archaeon]MCG2718143.1 translation initiation factor [Nanoarchaeota archaeon]
MGEICPKCGLPKELCVCETIAKKDQQITIKIEKRKFGKLITVIEGIEAKDIDVKDLAKKLKSKLACGGTAKDGKVELQGDHARKAKEILISLGFSPDTITVKSNTFFRGRR